MPEPTNRPKLILRVNRQAFIDWTQIQVVRSLDAIADTFDLAMLTRGASRRPPPDLAEGDECEVLYDGQKLIHGWIDRISERDDARGSSLTVSGRSRAGDLVDCAAIHKPWRSTPLLQIARDIAAPFKISVASDLSDLPTERYFKLSEGETAFAAIDRLVRGHGMRVTSKPDGSLLLTRTGLLRFKTVVIERGRNVVSAGIERSMEERFSHYIFKTQVACTDDVNGGAASPTSTVRDEGVPRYRPLVVERDTQGRTSGGQFTSEKVTHDLKEAAEWERNVRAGKAHTLSYSVIDHGNPSRSWENAEGLWEPNTIVVVRDKHYDIDGEYLVVEARFTFDSAGTRTELRLVAPEAYQPKKPPAKKKRKSRGTVY